MKFCLHLSTMELCRPPTDRANDVGPAISCRGPSVTPCEGVAPAISGSHCTLARRPLPPSRTRPACRYSRWHVGRGEARASRFDFEAGRAQGVVGGSPLSMQPKNSRTPGRQARQEPKLATSLIECAVRVSPTLARLIRKCAVTEAGGASPHDALLASAGIRGGEVEELRDQTKH